jgi:hypothetical protein
MRRLNGQGTAGAASNWFSCILQVISFRCRAEAFEVNLPLSLGKKAAERKLVEIVTPRDGPSNATG